MSSTKLTIGLTSPAVVAVMSGLDPAFTAWTLPAESAPSTKLTVGSMPCTMPLCAAKRIPPATGRMKVWIMSLIESTAGILSANISIVSKITSNSQHPDIGKYVERLGQLDEVEPARQPDDEQRQPCVQPRGSRQPEARDYI